MWHNSCVGACLARKALTVLCSGLSFQRHLDSKQSLKVEILSPSGIKSRHACCHYKGFNFSNFWIALLQHNPLYVYVSYGLLYSPSENWGSEDQHQKCQYSDYCYFCELKTLLCLWYRSLTYSPSIPEAMSG